MVHRKRSASNQNGSLENSSLIKGEELPLMDESIDNEEQNQYPPIVDPHQLSQDWGKNNLSEPRSVVVYGHHVPIDQYQSGNGWCEGWPHPGIAPILPPAPGECSPIEKSIVEATNLALAQATAIPEGRVVGVYFDKQRRIWRATWREHGQGKRKTKNFSVDDYGFEEARRMAIQFRLVKLMEASDQAMHEQEVLHHGVSSLSAEYKRTLTPSPGSNRRKRRRYGSPDSFAPKLPMWAQAYSTENIIQPEDLYPTSAIWPPLYGHPSTFVHMEHLRNTQQSWANNLSVGQPSDSRESTVATNDGMLDRTDMVSTVDSTIHDQAIKGYDTPHRHTGGLIC